MIRWYLFYNGAYIPVYIHYASPLFKLPMLRNFAAITLGRHIFCKDARMSTRLFLHELTHVKQQMREGMCMFYIKYLWEFFLRYYKQRDFKAAYHDISYEVEARMAENNEQRGNAI